MVDLIPYGSSGNKGEDFSSLYKNETSPISFGCTSTRNLSFAGR